MDELIRQAPGIVIGLISLAGAWFQGRELRQKLHAEREKAKLQQDEREQTVRLELQEYANERIMHIVDRADQDRVEAAKKEGALNQKINDLEKLIEDTRKQATLTDETRRKEVLELTQKLGQMEAYQKVLTDREQAVTAERDLLLQTTAEHEAELIRVRLEAQARETQLLAEIEDLRKQIAAKDAEIAAIRAELGTDGEVAEGANAREEV